MFFWSIEASCINSQVRATFTHQNKWYYATLSSGKKMDKSLHSKLIQKVFLTHIKRKLLRLEWHNLYLLIFWEIGMIIFFYGCPIIVALNLESPIRLLKICSNALGSITRCINIDSSRIMMPLKVTYISKLSRIFSSTLSEKSCLHTLM